MTRSIPPDREIGIVEWFRPGEHERVEESRRRLLDLRVRYLRTHLSWAEFCNAGGAAWYDWLFRTLAQDFEVLPCIHYTPPSLAETGRASGPPRKLRAFADFVDHVIDRYGDLFETIELWNEPNNLLDWDWRVDVDWLKFCTMVGAAAYWARQRGKRVVLGGPCPTDCNWLSLLGRRGVLGVVDVLGVHGFPGTWDSEEGVWPGWDDLIGQVRKTIHPYNTDLRIWITETGYATWKHDQFQQVKRFMEAAKAPVDRVYWYALQDLPCDVAVQEGRHFDLRHYHFGLYDAAGQPKLAARLMGDENIEAVLEIADAPRKAPAVLRTRPVLITGGAGFIGSNLANRLASEGHSVLVLDSLARAGVEENLEWLQTLHPARISAMIADVRSADAVQAAAADAAGVFHLASQVAVTSSLERPEEDFEINVRGTFNVLEAARRRQRPPPVIFASTNKVYGDLGDVALRKAGHAYGPTSPDLARHGVSEQRPLEFHTPYGCSKGAADQYVLDYGRSFGVPTAVLRMSCIYGPRQMGTEDQGWVAHFLIRALNGEPITIYGDGCQVRDILFVDDVVEAYVQTLRKIGKVAGRVFNMGGGPANAVSLLDILGFIGKLRGRPPELRFADWRPGDQKYYVSDIRSARKALGLPPPRPWRSGVTVLADWLSRRRLGHPVLARTGTVRAVGAAP